MGGRLNFLGGKSMKIDNYIKEEIITGKDSKSMKIDNYIKEEIITGKDNPKFPQKCLNSNTDITILGGKNGRQATVQRNGREGNNSRYKKDKARRCVDCNVRKRIRRSRAIENNNLRFRHIIPLLDDSTSLKQGCKEGARAIFDYLSKLEDALPYNFSFYALPWGVLSTRIYASVLSQLIDNNIAPLIIMGDHAQLLFTLESIKESHRDNVEVISFDAHIDLHYDQDIPISETPPTNTNFWAHIISKKLVSKVKIVGVRENFSVPLPNDIEVLHENELRLEKKISFFENNDTKKYVIDIDMDYFLTKMKEVNYPIRSLFTSQERLALFDNIAKTCKKVLFYSLSEYASSKLSLRRKELISLIYKYVSPSSKVTLSPIPYHVDEYILFDPNIYLDKANLAVPQPFFISKKIYKQLLKREGNEKPIFI